MMLDTVNYFLLKVSLPTPLTHRNLYPCSDVCGSESSTVRLEDGKTTEKGSRSHE